MIIQVGFCNFGRTYKNGQVQARRAMNKVHSAGKRIQWGFAEIEEAEVPDERKPMLHIFNDYSISGANTRVPILIPRVPYGTIIKRRPVVGCRGIPHWGPQRLITEAIVHLSDELGDMVRMNTHFHRQGPKANGLWDEHFAKLQRKTQYWLDRGLPVFGTADTNDHRERDFFKALHKDAKVIFNAGIDKGWYVLPKDNRLKVQVTHRRTVQMNIDRHNAQIGRLSITKKG